MARSLRFWLLASAAFALSVSSGSCAPRAAQTPDATVRTTAPLVEVEPVGNALTLAVNQRTAALRDEQAQGVVEGPAWDAAVALARDLDAALQVLTVLRSPRAGSLAIERQRLPDAPDGAPTSGGPTADGRDTPSRDTWGGSALALWVHALRAWELDGRPQRDAFVALQCDPPHTDSTAQQGSRGRTLPPWQRAATRAATLAGAGAPTDDREAPLDEDASSGDGAYDDRRDTAPATSPLGRALADFEHDAAKDYEAYGRCILERIDTAFAATDAALTPILRAALGDLHANAHVWLRERALPIDDGQMLGASDVRLRSPSAWTGLSASAAAVSASGVMIAVRSTGVSVAARPAVRGSSVLQGSNDERCTWPGIEVLPLRGVGRTIPLADLSRGMDAMIEAIQLCEDELASVSRDSVRAVIDAGVRWGTLAPILRRLLSVQRSPTLLVHEAQGGQLSALPIVALPDVSGALCGVEAHLRRDGVVLRGGGAETHLLSWSDADAFQRLTLAASQSADRCGSTQSTVRVLVDDPSVDWGLTVRVLERMSWPQACGERPCLRTVLVIGRDK